MVPVIDYFFYFVEPLNISDISTGKNGKEEKGIDILYYLNFMEEKNILLSNISKLSN